MWKFWNLEIIHQKPLKPITLINVMCENIYDYCISKLSRFHTERGFFLH